MKLYHFTAEHLWERIKTEGLTKGGVVQSLFPPKIKMGYRWLTKNPEFQQSWNAQFMVKYDRAAVRITIEIPGGVCNPRLICWEHYGRELTLPETYAGLNRYGDPQNWYVFKGNIPTVWFTEVTKRSVEKETPDADTRES